MTRLLLTGAAGGVARQLLPGLAAYDVVQTDRVPTPDGIGPVGDLRDPAFLAKVTADVDAVVHLAANPDPHASWDELREDNVDLVARLLSAGVRRYVLASSVHAMGEYVDAGRLPVDPDWAPAPCCQYGASKAFTEAIGRAHAFRTGAPVVALRIGGATEKPASTEVLGGWLGPTDLQRAVRCALEAEVRFAVCHAVSANTRSWWDLRNSIGYEPTQDSEVYAAQTPVLPGWGLCAGA